ncbi:MAG: hypothetical protein AABY54_02935 [Deltaproteobacteria bacterium]
MIFNNFHTIALACPIYRTSHVLFKKAFKPCQAYKERIYIAIRQDIKRREKTMGKTLPPVQGRL